MLTPRRRRGAEILDDAAVAPAVRERSIADVVRSNALFGGRRAAVRALREITAGVPAPATLTLLDVGSGLGDLADAARRALAPRGLRVVTIGLDEAHSLMRAARTAGRLDAAIAGDALRLPLRDASVDLVLCSQLLHHFTETDAVLLLAELHRVARVGVVVSDLRRSWLAAAGFWLASWPLRFHPVTRHDGVLSVLRGFTPTELGALVAQATRATPPVRRRLGWRLTTAWRASASTASAQENA